MTEDFDLFQIMLDGTQDQIWNSICHHCNTANIGVNCPAAEINSGIRWFWIDYLLVEWALLFNKLGD